MVRVFYSDDYVLAAHVFDTTRKSRAIAESLTSAPIRGVTLVAPTPLSPEQVLRVHAPEYVEAVRTGSPRALAESQGFEWDEGLWTMVLASNGGVVAAVRAALEDGVAGSLSSGLHHARREHGAGFCTFNGLAIGALAALDAGADRVLILDLDAHCGGGTQSLIAGDDRIGQLDVAVNGFDAYEPTERATLRHVSRAADYFPEIVRVLGEITRSGPAFDLCLYNAGMDPAEGCPNGGVNGITDRILAARETLVFDWCRSRGIPVAFVLAGGYVGEHLTPERLTALHRLTLKAAAGVNATM